MSDAADREIRHALWKIHVLHHAAQGPIYGLWMLRELERHGHHPSPGTLYPVLARMEENGWLVSSAASGHPKARRTYRATPAGRELLARLHGEIGELHAELTEAGTRPGSRARGARRGSASPGPRPSPRRADASRRARSRRMP